MIPRASIVTLSQTRLSCLEYGALDGHPLFFFHGWPGSNRQGSLLDPSAQQLGFRVIALNRPGIGASPAIPRALLDWPAMIREVAEQFGFSRYAVLGVSGGGPYALACAAMDPDRVEAASIVCGAPPLAELTDTRKLHPMYAFLLRLFRRRPDLVRRAFCMARPIFLWPDAVHYLPPMRIILPESDAAAIEDPERFGVVFLCQTDAFQNVDGLYSDAEIYARPWGFALEDIRVPVQFWHGRDDANFHHSLAEDMAARIPGSNIHVLDHEGHFSLPIRQTHRILAELANRLPKSGANS